MPVDPESKGGSEATVRIATADLVPTDHNLRPAYRDFAELEGECEAFCDRVNAREHRITRRAPAVMLAEERERLHPLPVGGAHGLLRADAPGVLAVHDLSGRRHLLGPVGAAQ